MSTELAKRRQYRRKAAAKHRENRRKDAQTDPLAGLPEEKREKARELFRFGDFDLKNNQFVGLKPGVSADVINPNWRSEALRVCFAAYAIDISSHLRIGEGITRAAEILALLIVTAEFSKPRNEPDNSGEVNFCWGEFWYLNDTEKDELSKLYLAALDHPDFLDLPDVAEGIKIGCDLVDSIVASMRNIQNPNTINDLRKLTIEAICADDRFAEPRFREAIKVIITGDTFSRKRTLTPDLATEASALYSERHERLRAAAKDYTFYKRKHSGQWLKYVARDDQERSGTLQIPVDLIKQLPLKSPREIALEWTAAEMNLRHPELSATPNTIRSLLKIVIKANEQTH